jgi:hypothetical protein
MQNETKWRLNMNAFRRAHDLTPEPSVALVTGGAVLGFDDQVHIDLDRAHTVLSPDEARRFAAELKRIADAIDPLSCRRRGSARIGQRDRKTFDMWMASHTQEEIAEACGCGQDIVSDGRAPVSGGQFLVFRSMRGRFFVH